MMGSYATLLTIYVILYHLLLIPANSFWIILVARTRWKETQAGRAQMTSAVSFALLINILIIRYWVVHFGKHDDVLWIIIDIICMIFLIIGRSYVAYNAWCESKVIRDAKQMAEQEEQRMGTHEGTNPERKDG